MSDKIFDVLAESLRIKDIKYDYYFCDDSAG